MKFSTMAKLSLFFSLLGLFTCGFFSPLGVIIALWVIYKREEDVWSTVGLALGALPTMWWFFGWLFVKFGL